MVTEVMTVNHIVISFVKEELYLILLSDGRKMAVGWVYIAGWLNEVFLGFIRIVDCEYVMKDEMTFMKLFLQLVVLKSVGVIC